VSENSNEGVGKRHDLGEETIEEVVKILRAEFE
jgi:hypothetical protein